MPALGILELGFRHRLETDIAFGLGKGFRLFSHEIDTSFLFFIQMLFALPVERTQ